MYMKQVFLWDIKLFVSALQMSWSETSFPKDIRKGGDRNPASLNTNKDNNNNSNKQKIKQQQKN